MARVTASNAQIAAGLNVGLAAAAALPICREIQRNGVLHAFGPSSTLLNRGEDRQISTSPIIEIR